MSEESKDKNYLRQLLGSSDYQPPSQKDLGHYFSGLQSVYQEFEYAPRSNPLLNEYLGKHRGAAGGVIDLTSSSTSLPPYEPAMRASASVSETKTEEMYGRLKKLMEQGQELAEVGGHIHHIESQLQGATPRQLDEVPLASLAHALSNVLAQMKPEQIDAIKSAYEKSTPILSLITECIEHCSDRDYAPLLPHDRREQRNTKEAVANFTLMACEEALDGTYTKTDGMRQQLTKINKEIAEERKRLPNEAQLAQQTEDINNKILKPAVIRMMQQLQGIDPKNIKPDNISFVNGTSTHIMDVALQTLTADSAMSKLLRGKQRKTLLVFSTSWDGLKTFGKDANMDTGLIEGSVNAQALDEHIQTHILQGRFADDLKGARAEVRKRVGALVMNIPENPVGKILSDKEMSDLAKVIEKYDIPVVLTDEIFAAPGHKSLITYPGMAQRSYVISSTSKNINTEDRLAFGYSDNDDFAKRVHAGLDRDKQLHPIEAAGYGAMLEETPASYFENNQAQYARNRKIVSEKMEQVNKDLKLTDGMKWLEEPNYGCLGVVTVPKSLTDGCGIENSSQLSEYIYKLSGVMAVPIGDVNPKPGQALGVRINFSEDDHVLSEAIERIGVAVNYMKQKRAYGDIEGDRYRGSSNRGSSSGILGIISDLFGSYGRGQS